MCLRSSEYGKSTENAGGNRASTGTTRARMRWLPKRRHAPSRLVPPVSPCHRARVSLSQRQALPHCRRRHPSGSVMGPRAWACQPITQPRHRSPPLGQHPKKLRIKRKQVTGAVANGSARLQSRPPRARASPSCPRVAAPAALPAPARTWTDRTWTDRTRSHCAMGRLQLSFPILFGSDFPDSSARGSPTAILTAGRHPIPAGNVQRRKVIHGHGVRRDSEPASAPPISPFFRSGRKPPHVCSSVQASWAGIVIGVFRFGTEPFVMSKMFPAVPDRVER